MGDQADDMDDVEPGGGEDLDEEDSGDEDGEEEEEEDDDDDEQRLAEIKSLRAQLKQDAGSFSLRMRLTALLKAEADLPGVRKAREALAAARPLPEAAWLEWIDDEERLASGDELREVIRLAERASADGLSVAVWLRYVRLTAKLQAPHLLPAIDAAAEGDFSGEAAAAAPDAGAAGAHAVRAALERALTPCGLHVSDGAQLWNAYEAFEATQLRGAGGAEPEQRARVRKLWRRRLAVPHFGMDGAWQRYAQFEVGGAAGGGVDAGGGAEGLSDAAKREVEATERVYTSASRGASARRQHELKVAAAAASAGAASGPWGAGENTEWGAWEAYLAYETSPALGGNDPWRVRLLYERMLTPTADAWARADAAATETTAAFIASHEAGELPPTLDPSALPPCARPALWRRYILFLTEHLPAPALRVEATARAIRCCAAEPWLWVERLRALEEARTPAPEVRTNSLWIYLCIYLCVYS